MNFIIKYFPEYIENRFVQEEILRQFAYPICGEDTKLVTNVLFRGKIRSLEKLYKTPIEDIKKLRNVGQRRIDYIIKMKHELSKIIASQEKQTL